MNIQIKPMTMNQEGLDRKDITHGFTLVELLVALALSVFLIGGVLLMYTSGRAASIDAEQLSRMQENMRFSSDYLVRDVRNAGFRDQLTLSFPQFESIGKQFARIHEGRLQIRYAGRGSCTERFDEFKMVQNDYFVQDGNLVCQGFEIGLNGTALTSTGTNALATGVTDVAFTFLYNDGSEANSGSCNFHESDAVNTACIGVRIALEMQGLRAADGGGNFETRTAEFTAAFRNVIIDQVYGR